MFLSESYKSRLQYLSGIISESKSSVEYEFQIRDIGGSVFYMRKKGEDVWCFITPKEFAKKCHQGKMIKWNKK